MYSMIIRQATRNDINRLVEIDREAYGKYGAENQYFEEKFQFFPQGILLVEEDGKATGFTVMELLEANQIPKDFSDLKLTEKLAGKWIHIIAFTTSTNYRDREKDYELLKAAEKIATEHGCVSCCVPLTKNHPFKKHGVFDFWKANGYKVAGNINWVVSPSEKMGCYFYKKDI